MILVFMCLSMILIHIRYHVPRNAYAYVGQYFCNKRIVMLSFGHQFVKKLNFKFSMDLNSLSKLCVKLTHISFAQ